MHRSASAGSERTIDMTLLTHPGGPSARLRHASEGRNPARMGAAAAYLTTRQTAFRAPPRAADGGAYASRHHGTQGRRLSSALYPSLTPLRRRIAASFARALAGGGPRAGRPCRDTGGIARMRPRRGPSRQPPAFRDLFPPRPSFSFDLRALQVSNLNSSAIRITQPTTVANLKCTSAQTCPTR